MLHFPIVLHSSANSRNIFQLARITSTSTSTTTSSSPNSKNIFQLARITTISMDNSTSPSANSNNIFQSARITATSRNKTASRFSSSSHISALSSSSSNSHSKEAKFQFTCPICTATFESATSEFADRHANRCLEQREANEDNQLQNSPPSKRTLSKINLFQTKSISSQNHEQQLIKTETLAFEEEKIAEEKGKYIKLGNKSDGLNPCSQSKSTLSLEWQFLKPLESAFPNIKVLNNISPQVVQQHLKLEVNVGKKTKEKKETRIAAAPKKICPPHKWIPNTSFTVDAFAYGEIPNCTAYFLTHFHADHYAGLSGKFNYAPLYCSQITANLLQLKYKINPELIHPLPLNKSIMIQGVELICYEANHCPGALMLVFKAKNKTYLHTGDFRATPQLLDDVLPHHPFDCVFLDTTYLNPDYAFPPQSFILSLFGELTNRVSHNLPIVLANPKAKKGETLWDTLTPLPQISNDPFLPSPLTVHPQLHCQKLFSTPVRNLLVVVGTYTIGKEKLAFELCRRLNSSLHCAKDKHKILRCCLNETLYTPDPLRAQIHLVQMRQLYPELLQMYLDQFDNHFSHLLALRPTGWTMDKADTLDYLSDIQPTMVSEKIALVNVPYSEHSSFEELKRFVLGLQITHIQPTVPTKNHHFLEHWQLIKKKNGGPLPWDSNS